jgi:pectin methylesterase-like acyl-CoA thioesterase
MVACVGVVLFSSIVMLTHYAHIVHPPDMTSPGNLPPADTLSMAMYCIDVQGCCTFTTMQVAIDAVPDHIRKRSVIWINSGTYM